MLNVYAKGNIIDILWLANKSWYCILQIGYYSKDLVFLSLMAEYWLHLLMEIDISCKPYILIRTLWKNPFFTMILHKLRKLLAIYNPNFFLEYQIFQILLSKSSLINWNIMQMNVKKVDWKFVPL